ncbi:FAD-dependent monooxygenase [Pseudonocardia nantongensis]|uniref:FAD-dependent monooxygenase n=1 Tax=Pseudonocardia nantongensis TaxID=1181885 RepID=UPI00397BFA95
MAILAKLRSGGRDEVTVHERNPAGETHGFAVTFGEDLLDEAFRNDPEGGPALRRVARLWNAQQIRVGDHRPVHVGGKYGYSIARVELLDVLARRAEQLGVDVRYGEPTERADVDADVVVAADGVSSRLRTGRADHFGTTVTEGSNRYVWLGADSDSDTFVWDFQRTDAGWVWIHLYPSSNGLSTCIVECEPDTWTGLGLDALPAREGIRMIQSLFSRTLGENRLIEPLGGIAENPWLRFREVRNRTWRDGDLVLAGDAAHTTHFGIGSGTVLAMQDSMGLADALYGGPGDPREPAGPNRADGRGAALAAYDARRRAVVTPVQDAARRNMHFFEQAGRQLDRVEDPVEFAWSLTDRRGDMGRIHYQLHKATQIGPLRQVRRGLTTARRVRRAALREGGRAQRDTD